MYVPKHFEESDVSVLHALIEAHPLGTWVIHAGAELLVNHVPFLIDSSRGPLGTLIGHVARANPVWQSFSKQVESVVVFQGPQAYISPSWYPSKHEHGKAVPTWNYAVVHAHGSPRCIEDRAWLLNHVSQLSAHHEAKRALPWRVSDAPEDYITNQLGAIVGIEIPITRLVGKWKVSQNRPTKDKLGAIAGLQAQGDTESLEMARLISERASRGS